MSLDYSGEEPIIFPYKEFEITTSKGKEKIWRPLALVGLTRKNFRLDALIDTGSDKTISWLNPIAHRLGLADQFDEGEPTETIKGLFGDGSAWYDHVQLWIGDHQLNVPIYWLTQEYSIDKGYQIILGGKIIFDNFDVIFKKKGKKVYFYKK